MSIILDIIGSWVVRATMIAIMLTLSVNLNNALFQNATVISDRDLVSIVDSVFYADINAAGYNAPSWGSADFKWATTSSVYFWADVNNNGSADSIRYDVVYNSNTKKYRLYRTLNNGTGLAVGNPIDSLSFSYYANGYDGKDSLMLTPTQLKSIRAVGITLVVLDTITDSKTGVKTPMPIKSFFKVTPPNLL